MTETGEQADLSEAINAIALTCGIDPASMGMVRVRPANGGR